MKSLKTYVYGKSFLVFEFFISLENRELILLTSRGIGKFDLSLIGFKLFSFSKVFISNKSLLGLFLKSFELLVMSLSKGFFQELLFKGIGYKCQYIDGYRLFVSLGYSHYIVYTMPDSILIFLKKGRLCIYGLSKEMLGVVITDLKNMRLPDVYIGKGVLSLYQFLSLKEGKKR